MVRVFWGQGVPLKRESGNGVAGRRGCGYWPFNRAGAPGKRRSVGKAAELLGGALSRMCPRRCPGSAGRGVSPSGMVRALLALLEEFHGVGW